MAARQPGFLKRGEPVRLQAFLARSGIASRRAAEEMITHGRIAVNGETVTAMGLTVVPGVDRVEVDGEEVKVAPTMWLALHKPKGYVTTRIDPYDRRTVYDLLPEKYHGLFHVGRLDRDSEGLLLLTNDGDLANRFLHPSFGITKEYEVVGHRQADGRGAAAAGGGGGAGGRYRAGGERQADGPRRQRPLAPQARSARREEARGAADAGGAGPRRHQPGAPALRPHRAGRAAQGQVPHRSARGAFARAHPAEARARRATRTAPTTPSPRSHGRSRRKKGPGAKSAADRPARSAIRGSRRRAVRRARRRSRRAPVARQGW